MPSTAEHYNGVYTLAVMLGEIEPFDGRLSTSRKACSNVAACPESIHTVGNGDAEGTSALELGAT